MVILCIHNVSFALKIEKYPTRFQNNKIVNIAKNTAREENKKRTE